MSSPNNEVKLLKLLMIASRIRKRNVYIIRKPTIKLSENSKWNFLREITKHIKRFINIYKKNNFPGGNY